MTNKKLRCIRCPAGCEILVEETPGEVVSVAGNGCPQGAEYARRELTDPTRVVTTTVRVRGADQPVVPVRTAGEIPRDMVSECLEVLHSLVLDAPVAMGQTLLENVGGTGIAVVTTRKVDAVCCFRSKSKQ